MDKRGSDWIRWIRWRIKEIEIECMNSKMWQWMNIRKITKLLLTLPIHAQISAQRWNGIVKIAGELFLFLDYEGT